MQANNSSLTPAQRVLVIRALTSYFEIMMSVKNAQADAALELWNLIDNLQADTVAGLEVEVVTCHEKMQALMQKII